MSTNHDWTYYRRVYYATDTPPNYFRYMGGITDRLDQTRMTWVSLETDALSRYIERGEVGLDEMTRAEIDEPHDGRHHLDLLPVRLSDRVTSEHLLSVSRRNLRPA